MALFTRLAVPLLVISLAGCAGLQQGPAPVEGAGIQVADDARAVLELLLRTDTLASQSAEVQHRELLAAQAAFEANPGDGLTRLRLALALSMPRSAHRDDARVLALLDDWPPGPEPSLRREVAQLVYRLVQERQRQVRDDQRRYDLLRDEHRRSEVSLREAHKKLEELLLKLDALRTVDRDARRKGRH